MVEKINLREILSGKKPKVGDTLFIAIDGHGGSGKSSLAQLLSDKLNASIIHTDDFASWNNPINWWPQVIEKVFEPIKDGAKSLSYPRSTWWDNHDSQPIVEQSVTPVMILEGVSSSRKEFSEYISLKVFVNTPKEICFQRGVERDSGTGKTKEEILKLWEQWFVEEEEYMRRDLPLKHADIVLDGTKPFAGQIEV